MTLERLIWSSISKKRPKRTISGPSLVEIDRSYGCKLLLIAQPYCFNHKTNITCKQAIIFFCVLYIIADQSNKINKINIYGFFAVWYKFLSSFTLVDLLDIFKALAPLPMLGINPNSFKKDFFQLCRCEAILGVDHHHLRLGGEAQARAAIVSWDNNDYHLLNVT